jgi:hypothetical protein
MLDVSVIDHVADDMACVAYLCARPGHTAKLGLVVEGLPCRVELLTGKRIPRACLHGAVLSFGIRSRSLVEGTESEPSDV